MSAALLHLVVARLRDDLDEPAAAELTALAAALRDAEGAQATLVARSSRELIAATWLRSPDALEAFASAPEHLRFVLEGLGRGSTGMWSASVGLSGPAAGVDGEVCGLWAFGLPAEPPAFEWQVQELLAAIAALPGAAAAGPTAEEREHFRAAGVVCVPRTACSGFEQALAAARAGWGDLGERLQHAYAPLIAA